MSSRSLLRLSFLAASFGGLVLAAVSDPEPKVLDPIATLEERITAGKAKLDFESGQGYLKSILKELDIPWSSQALVWTKTSLQGFYISPKKPRAIYFNESSYVGWVNGGELIEIITVHPEMGARFYSIRNQQMPQVEFRDDFNRCIGCHAGRGLGRIPRLFAKSTFANPDGREIVRESGLFMSPRTPIKSRWGGWYVTGSHGPQRHRGNSFASPTGDPDNPLFDAEAGANQSSLSSYFDTSQYLTGSSDIVALMVMEHQMAVQNEISRTGIALRAGEPLADSCEPLVEVLLSNEETPLTSPIKGNTQFQSDYEKRGPKDAKGRYLRELDLKTRLFKSRVSPMIASAAFAALPEDAKKHIFARFSEILKGSDKSGKFKAIPESERRATREMILAVLGPVL